MENECQQISYASVALPIFGGKGDIVICGRQRGVKLLECAIKIVEKVLEKNYSDGGYAI